MDIIQNQPKLWVYCGLNDDCSANVKQFLR